MQYLSWIIENFRLIAEIVTIVAAVATTAGAIGLLLYCNLTRIEDLEREETNE